MKQLIAILVLAYCANLSAADGLIHKASFEETYKRYPSVYGVIQQFRRIIPFQADDFKHECLGINKNSGPVTGAIDPLQLAPLESQPGDLFYQYYIGCVRDLVYYGFYSAGPSQQKNVNKILGEKLNQELKENYLANCTDSCREKDKSEDEIYANAWGYYSSGWGKVSRELRAKLVDRFITYLIGPDRILEAYGYIGEKTAFGVSIQDRKMLIELLMNHLERKNHDSFSDVYAEIAILLRLGPALKS